MNLKTLLYFYNVKSKRQLRPYFFFLLTFCAGKIPLFYSYVIYLIKTWGFKLSALEGTVRVELPSWLL